MAMRRDKVGSRTDGVAALTRRERRVVGRVEWGGVFRAISATSVVAPADRGGLTVTLGGSEYKAGVKIRGRDSGLMSSAAIVVVRQD